MKKAKIIFGSVLSAMIILTACQKDEITPPNVNPMNKSEVVNLPSTPVSISITKITVDNFPALTPRGRTWDFYSPDVSSDVSEISNDFTKLTSNWVNPDIYPVITYALEKIVDPEHTLVNLKSQFRGDATNTRDYFWTFKGLKFQFPTRPHRIALYDYDGKTSQLMGAIIFTPAERGYPSELYISNGTISFILDVQYQWYE